jgi:hypothetical protein
MICPNCLESSQHAMCPYCGEVQIVGGLLDDVLSYVPTPGKAYELGKSITSDGGAPSPSSDGGGPSLLDRIPNPFSSAYDVGKSAGASASSTLSNLGADVRAPFDALSSMLTVLKWVVIGGAVVGAVVLLYGVFKFVPIALGAAAHTTAETTKMIPHLLKAAV